MRLKRNCFLMGGVVFLCTVSLVLGGCAPLKKKFTRKKKKESEHNQDFIPVLEPIDYPDKLHSPQEHYERHYSLWKIWDRDLQQSIERQDSDKRQKYLLAKMLGELGEMKSYLAESKRMELDQVIQDLTELQEVYQKPAVMRSRFTIKKQLSTSAKKIRNEFSPRQSLPFQEE